MANGAELNAPSPLREADPWELAVALQAMRRHLAPSCAIVLACLVVAALSLLLPGSYTADAILTYDPQTPLIRGGGDLPLSDPLRDAEIDAQLALATSLPVAEDVARTIDPAANPRLQREAEALASRSDRTLSRFEALGMALLDHVKAKRIGQTPEFTISVTAGSAEQAARISNACAQSYLKAAIEQKAALAGASTRQLAAKVAQLRRQATQAEADLTQFRVANDLLDTPDSAALGQEVATLRTQLADARGQAALAGTRSAAAAGQTVVGGGNGGSVDTTPVSLLTQQRATSAADLAALLGRHGEKHPDVIIARRKLAELDAQLDRAIQGNGHSAAAEAQAAAARAQALAASLADAQARLAGLLGHGARLLDLQNSALAARQAYQDILKVSADQTTQRALIQPDAQQIGLATPPLRPTFPRPGLNLLVGLGAGLLISVILAFIRESWRHTLVTVDDIGRWLEADFFTPLPLLTAGRGNGGAKDPVEAVLSHPYGAFAESIRSLGQAAIFAARTGNSGGRVIGIASAVAGEGKTTVSIAMGRVLTAAGTKVALLAWPGDGPPSSARAHRINGNELTLPGGNADSFENPDLPDLDVSRFVQMVAALRPDYEVIIINMPPVLPSGANRQLLESLDALVLLARWRATPVRAVRQAMRQIAAAGGHVSGVALSMTQRI